MVRDARERNDPELDPASPRVTLGPIDDHEVDAAVEVLVNAFLDDATYRYIFPDSRLRAVFVPHLISATLNLTRRRGVIVGAFSSQDVPLSEGTATRRLLGVALWYTPDRPWPGPVLSQLRALSFKLCWLYYSRLGFRSRSRWSRIARAEKAVQWERQRGTRFWHLAGLGVLPAFQGKGIGTTLVRDGLARAGQTRVCADTTDPQSRKLFDRLGFECRYTLHVKSAPITFSSLFHDPGGGTP